MQTLSPRPASSFTPTLGLSGTPPHTPSPVDPLISLMTQISRLKLSELDILLAMGTADQSSTSGSDDQELALVLFAREAQGLLHIARDHILDHHGDHDSDELLDELLTMEENAEYDRAVALALSQDRDPPTRPPPRRRPRRRVPAARGPERQLTATSLISAQADHMLYSTKRSSELLQFSAAPHVHVKETGKYVIQLGGYAWHI